MVLIGFHRLISLVGGNSEMRKLASFIASAAMIASVAHGADYKTLRNLTTAPPIKLEPLPAGVKARPVQFARAVLEPKVGEAWALAYYSVPLDDPDNPRPTLGFLNWNSGRAEADASAFGRIFDEELKQAGFSVPTESLFGDGASGADLKVGVRIDDMKGRFCADCPNLFNQKGIPATVVLNANWEVFSALERKVVLTVTTSGGADYRKSLRSGVLPAVYEGFRENVRMLLANDDFRRLVTSQQNAPSAAGVLNATTPVSFSPAPTVTPISQASRAVGIVYASDGSGSGFLIGREGYLLTNHHVVGASKFVKVKWAGGGETLGEVIRSDRRRDVALVKVDPQDRTPLSLRGGETHQGEPVFAIGTPLDDALQNTMTKGIVSANRTIEGLPFIQSDVAINHGNSGGPLIDEKGQVIGIAVLGLLPGGASTGLNFFIPIDDALRALSLTPATPPAPAHVETRRAPMP
jgi:S1-C subfamily serine protease